jgi:hypothetical protein
MHPVLVVLSALPPVLLNPLAHVEHSPLPGPLNLLSAPHGVTMLPPSHQLPAAHAVHAVRVFASPPLVLEPAGQTSHLVAAVAAEYILSLPQLTQLVCSLFEYLPGTQRTSLLEPSHAYPTGHDEQVVRVSSVFPDVYEPDVHVEHSDFPLSLYSLLVPQLEHVVAPAFENLPAGHTLLELVPSHVEPAAHSSHPVWVVREPPVVVKPARHTLQELAGAF